MTNTLTLVLAAIELLLAKLLAGMLSTLADVTGCALCLFATVTRHWHIYVAGWAGSRVTVNFAVFVLAIFVFLLITILTATMWQKQRVILRLAKPSTVALVDGHLTFSIAKIAVWTGPTIKRQQLFSLLSSNIIVSLFIIILLLIIIVILISTLF